MSRTYVHRLFVRATAASAGVFAPAGEKSVQIRPIRTEVTRAHTPPIAYRTHSNTLQRLQVATRYGALLGADPRPRLRLICGN
jgi:hypothetical protein